VPASRLDHHDHLGLGLELVLGLGLVLEVGLRLGVGLEAERGGAIRPRPEIVIGTRVSIRVRDGD
jgi:hypothetical protein